MNKSHVAFKKTQKGVTLVLALLILVMIMMYGIPAAMNSIQNERMTGNTRQRDLAFQSAEHALRAADTWIHTKTAAQLDVLAPAAKLCPDDPSNPDGTDDTDSPSDDGVLPNGECHSNNADYWRNTFDWTKGISPSNDIDAALVATQPVYVVERMPDVSYCQPSGLPPPCTSPDTAVPKNYYRVTARGVGKDSNAIVILQTMYVFE